MILYTGVEGYAMDPKLELNLNVLGIQEDNASWCAIALEMSLMGYGGTFEKALEDLYDAIVTQVTFAVQHDTLDNIFIPAEPQYFTMYADAKREALKGKLAHREGSLTHLRAGNIPLPEPRSETFKPATA